MEHGLNAWCSQFLSTREPDRHLGDPPLSPAQFPLGLLQLVCPAASPRARHWLHTPLI